MRYMKKKDIMKLIKIREKEGIICLPTAYGYMFYNPNDRSRKDICIKVDD